MILEATWIIHIDNILIYQTCDQSSLSQPHFYNPTVDGSEILHELRLVVYPIIYKVLHIPGGTDFFRQQLIQSSLVPLRNPI